MPSENYQRIKEAEKEHLRKLKKLKEAARQLARQKRLSQAVDNITSGPRETLDTHEALMEQLAFETAQQEARLDIALENQQLDEPAAGTIAPDDLEEELLAERAKTLLRQMKQQMGVPDEEPGEAAPPARREEAASEAEPPENPPAAAERPEKTIGRMR